MNLPNCESVKGAFFKIKRFAGKRFLFLPPFPLPAASISVALAPIFAPPKSEKRLERAENHTETLATQAKMNAMSCFMGGLKKLIQFSILYLKFYTLLLLYTTNLKSSCFFYGRRYFNTFLRLRQLKFHKKKKKMPYISTNIFSRFYARLFLL